MANTNLEEQPRLAIGRVAHTDLHQVSAQQRPRNIGFVSTRFAGTDGVSLETEKWAHVLQGLGHHCFYLAGECDRPADRSSLVAEAHFGHHAIDAIGMAAFSSEWGLPDLIDYTNPEISQLHQASFSNRLRPPAMTRRIHELTQHLKEQLYTFVRDFELEVLVVQNALSIPMNIPLGLALTEFIAETGFPTIAHHHDFYWERKRYNVNCVADYLHMAFPPRLPSIRHVVINSMAAQQLSLRTGASAMLIPNVMDFAHPPAPPDEYTRMARLDLGVADTELLILQPTRVIQRKGIESAVELARRLERPARVVISHASGDEGSEYERRVRAFAELLDVPVTFESEIIAERRSHTPDGRRRYTLWDVYPHADLVTYPSRDEGFGNAFLEAVYFRRPVVVNNYPAFDVDIKRKGFRVIEFEDFITECVVRQARQMLGDSSLAQAMAETNYHIGLRHYSFAVLERRLQTLLADIFGEEVEESESGRARANGRAHWRV
jgi:mannosylglucosylglycerate synthase